MKQHKPNCFEKTKVRWGIFSFFSSTKVEMKNVCPIAGNTEGISEVKFFRGFRSDTTHINTNVN